MSPYEHLLIGQILTTQIRLPADGLEAALKQQENEEREKKAARSLGHILVDRQLATQEQIEAALTYQRDQFALIPVGAYCMQSMIGRGSTGVVYKAKQLSARGDSKSVALKLLPQKKSGDVDSLARFQREAQAGVALDHPAIVRTLDFGTTRDSYYLVYELMTGGTLSDRVRIHGPLLEIETLNLAVSMLQALDYASARGLVHRDIKPANILFDEKDTAHLADLGLAQLINVQDGGPKDLTAGTPAFIAPEQALGQELNDARSDIYSLGCTLYFALTGSPPFAEKRSLDAINCHLNEAPPDLESYRLGISAHTSAVIRKMMAKRLADRYASPAEAIADVRRVQNGERPLAMALTPAQAYAPLKVHVQRHLDENNAAAHNEKSALESKARSQSYAETSPSRGHRIHAQTGKHAGRSQEPETEKQIRPSLLRREGPTDSHTKSAKRHDNTTDHHRRGGRPGTERPGTATRSRQSGKNKVPWVVIGIIAVVAILGSSIGILMSGKGALTENDSAENAQNDEATLPEPLGTTVNLLEYLDDNILRDEDWLNRDDVLLSPRGAQRLLAAPYLPPSEYDLTCSFKRLYPSGAVSLLFDFAGRNIAFVITGDENMRAGFEMVHNGDMAINGTEFINPEPLSPDKRISVTIKVRRDSMTAFIGNKEVSHLTTSGQGLSIDPTWTLPKRHVLGIGTKTTQVAVFKWRLVEVSGIGAPITAKDLKKANTTSQNESDGSATQDSNQHIATPTASE